MSQESISAAPCEPSPLFDLWEALVPIRERAEAIDWQKVIAMIQQLMPLILAVLDLLPKQQPITAR